jgi:hypothetical protein
LPPASGFIGQVLVDAVIGEGRNAGFWQTRILPTSADTLFRATLRQSSGATFLVHYLPEAAAGALF